VPTYGYRCQRCGAEFDVWQRMADEPGADCPVCGGPGRRQFFPAGIVFKGTGFYKTDSRGASSASSSASDGAKTSKGAPEKHSADAGDRKRAASSEPSSSSGTTAATPGAG